MRPEPQPRLIRLMMFCNTKVRGGAEEHILTLLHGLDRSLFQLYFACPPALADLVRADVPPDVELLHAQVQGFTDIGGAWRLRRSLRERGIDLIHSHMFYSSLFASPIAKLSGVPVVMETGHGREVWRRGWKKNYAVDRWVGRFVDQYIAVSESTARYMVEDKRLPQTKISVIQNGCDLQRFHGVTALPELRAAVGAAPADPILVVPGRLETQKGHTHLLDAMPTVLRSFPNMKLAIVGDGVLRQQLEAQAQRLELNDAVRFVGYRSNIEEWMALADVVVMPSLYEGLPLVAIEALASTRALVATAVDGTTEVVVDGKTGRAVGPGSAEELADAIIGLLGNADERTRLAQAGRQWVEQRFSRALQIRRTQDLYLATMQRCADWNPRASSTTANALEGRATAEASLR